jgi:hypothetical protein
MAPINKIPGFEYSATAVKHLLLCRIDQRPPRLDMENDPHLPLAQVRATQAADYMSLLTTPSNTGAIA